MERIDGVEVGNLAEDALLRLVERGAHFLEVIFLAGSAVCVGEVGLDHVGAREARPRAGGRGDGVGVLLLEVRGNLAAEALDDRVDAVGLHTVVDPTRQLDALLEPRIGQRAAHGVEILHVEPGEVRGAGEVLLDLLVGVVVLEQRLAQDLLLAHDVKHQIHAVHGAPVEEGLVLVPVPERHGVGVGAEVERVAVLVVGELEDALAHRGEGGGHVELRAEERVVVDLAVVAQVVVEARGQRDAVVAADLDAPAARIGDLEDILAVELVAQLEDELVAPFGAQDALDQVARLGNDLLVGVFLIGLEAVPLLAPLAGSEVLDLDVRLLGGGVGDLLAQEGDLGDVDLLLAGVVAHADARGAGLGGFDVELVGVGGGGVVVGLVSHLIEGAAVFGQVDLVVVVGAGHVLQRDAADAVRAVEGHVDETAVVLHRVRTWRLPVGVGLAVDGERGVVAGCRSGFRRQPRERLRRCDGGRRVRERAAGNGSRRARDGEPAHRLLPRPLHVKQLVHTVVLICSSARSGRSPCIQCKMLYLL